MEAKKPPRQPTATDVMNMLALQNQAASLGKRCLEVYVTHPTALKDVIGALATAREKVDEITEGQKPPDSCIDPYVLCDDGYCRLERDCPS